MNIHELAESIVRKKMSRFTGDDITEVESILTQWLEDLVGEDEASSTDIHKKHIVTARGFCQDCSKWVVPRIQDLDIPMRNKIKQQLRTKAGLTPPQKGE